MSKHHVPAPVYDHILRFQRQPKLQPSQVAEGFASGQVYVIARPDWYWRWVRRDKIKAKESVAQRVAAKRERQLNSLVAAMEGERERQANRAAARSAERRRQRALRARD